MTTEPAGLRPELFEIGLGEPLPAVLAARPTKVRPVLERDRRLTIDARHLPVDEVDRECCLRAEQDRPDFCPVVVGQLSQGSLEVLGRSNSANPRVFLRPTFVTAL